MVPADWPTLIFSLGLIILIWGIFNHFFPSSDDQKRIETSNTQRNLAIEEALKRGEKTYQFETNFIPGIGVVNDPEAYREQLEEQLNP